MKSRKKLVQTGLKIDVKPISDKGLTEEEYMAKVAELKKEAEIKKQQETLNKVAEEHFAQRRPRGPVQRPQQRRGITSKGNTSPRTYSGSIASRRSNKTSRIYGSIV